jgi:cell envelope opacity-associated protein A
MSETFQFIIARAKEYPQVTRRSQMSKQVSIYTKTTGDKKATYTYALTPRTSAPIILA